MESQNALDAPPDYDSIFGGPSSSMPAPSSGQLLNVATAPPSITTGTSPHQEDSRDPDDVSESSSSRWFCCKDRPVPIIVMYLVLLVLGVLISSTMIILSMCSFIKAFMIASVVS